MKIKLPSDHWKFPRVLEIVCMEVLNLKDGLLNCGCTQNLVAELLKEFGQCNSVTQRKCLEQKDFHADHHSRSIRMI